MEKNKTGKYLKYAIGEIVLVVIGILIALSLNNWKETRQETLQEVKILKQLRADLIDNQEEAEIILSEVKLRLRYSDSIILFFNEKRKLDDSLVTYLTGIRHTSFFNSANTAYKYIQSEGMNIVSNDSLRTRLTMMYEKEFRNIDLRGIGEDKIQNEVLEPFIRKNFKPISWDTHNVNYVKAQIQPINIEALYGNFEFQNILLEHNAYLQVRNRWLEDSLKKLEELIEEVQNEIKRLEN
ncbi:MAG: DUF6090 family protein [Psychroserpens sp.]|uniref:DUF6090 family protein n=1 Tax=Psychroserpens sp. TaxID=2020870 RepID=UPI003002EB14